MNPTAALLAATLTLSSCAVTYQVESPVRESGKEAQLNIRRTGVASLLVATRVYANGSFIGQIGPGRYISVWLPSGEYLLQFRQGPSFFASKYYKVALQNGGSKMLQARVGMTTFGLPYIKPVTDTSFLHTGKPPRIAYSR